MRWLCNGVFRNVNKINWSKMSILIFEDFSLLLLELSVYINFFSHSAIHYLLFSFILLAYVYLFISFFFYDSTYGRFIRTQMFEIFLKINGLLWMRARESNAQYFENMDFALSLSLWYLQKRLVKCDLRLNFEEKISIKPKKMFAQVQKNVEICPYFTNFAKHWQIWWVILQSFKDFIEIYCFCFHSPANW